MMQYDFTDKSSVINDLDMEETMYSYSTCQQQQEKYCFDYLQTKSQILICFCFKVFLNHLYPIVI
jgi:hypothetical protein